METPIRLRPLELLLYAARIHLNEFQLILIGFENILLIIDPPDHPPGLQLRLPGELLLAIEFEGGLIVLEPRLKLPLLIQAGPPRQQRIDVRGIQLQHNTEILNRIVNLAHLLMRRPQYEIGPHIPTIDIEERVCVFNGLFVLGLLHPAAGTDEQGFFVGGVLL